MEKKTGVNPEKSEQIDRTTVLREKVEGIMNIESGNLGKGDWENRLGLFMCLKTTVEKRFICGS